MTLNPQVNIDNTDLRLIEELQADARLTYVELGRRVGLSSPAVKERVQRLEELRVITGYHATIDMGKLGLPVTVFVHLTTVSGMCFSVQAFALEQKGVIEAYCVTGEKDVIIKAMLPSVEAIEHFVEQLMPHGKITTSVVLTQGERRMHLPSNS